MKNVIYRHVHFVCSSLTVVVLSQIQIVGSDLLDDPVQRAPAQNQQPTLSHPRL